MARSDVLYVTDAECAERIGVTTEEFKSIVPVAEKSGMPTKDPLFKNKRYWPAVRAWLDRRYGLSKDKPHAPYARDEKEPWK
jgi:hypothetical protein